MDRRRAIVFVAAAAALAGCGIGSGERSTRDGDAQSGNLTTTFLGFEGTSTRDFAPDTVAATYAVIVVTEIERGELRIEVLDATGAVVISSQPRAGAQASASGSVRSGADGVVRYRVSGRGARNGGFQILYTRQ